MKCKISWLCCGLFVCCFTQNASAYDFTDKIYGKASAKVGYNVKHHVGSYLNTYLKGYAQGSTPNKKDIVHTRSTQHYLTIGAGYDFYYKLNDLLHPFIGLETTFMFPIGGRTFAKQYPYADDAYIPARMLSTIQEYFIFHQRTGVKINLIKNFSLLSYTTLGFNVLKSDRFNRGNVKHAKNDVGFSFGCGIEALYLDRFSFALEYRFTRNKSIRFDYKDKAQAYGFIDGNNAIAKFGYYFL